MGKLREAFEGMDPELKDLIADGNHEIAEIEDDAVTSDFEFPTPTRELTAAEDAALDERIDGRSDRETVRLPGTESG
jgi:hypothetical protein